MTVSEDNPNDFLPGTWEKVEGRFLLGSGVNDNTTYTVGSTGGERLHKLTSAESGVASHEHRVYARANGGSNQNVGCEWQTTTTHNISGLAVKNDASWTIHAVAPQTKDASSAHNNMPPYLVVNIWKRVS
jgi:microcystin-dependent protein